MAAGCVDAGPGGHVYGVCGTLTRVGQPGRRHRLRDPDHGGTRQARGVIVARNTPAAERMALHDAL